MIQRRKTATLNLRIEPEIKAAAEKAAAEDRRSLTSLLEMLLLKHLRRRGYLKALLVAATTLMITGPAWADKPIVAMYGDSTTRGYTLGVTGYTTPNNEPALLQKDMPDAVIENHGVGGITCFDLLNSAGSGRAPHSWLPNNWWQEMSASKATIVTINLGMNDAFYADEDFYKQCMTSLVTIAQGYGKVVVIETPNPLGPSFTQPWRDRLMNFAADARDVALDNQAFVIDQWTYDQEFESWQTHLPDGIHPDDALYKFKAVTARCVIGPLLKSLGP